MPMVTFQFHLPAEHYGALQKLAHERGMAVAEIVRPAVARVLDEELGRGVPSSASALEGVEAGVVTAPASAAPGAS
jgi:hypothetical protein